MSILLQILEILFGGLVILSFYIVYLGTIHRNQDDKKTDEKESNKNNKTCSPLSSKGSEKASSPSLRSREVTCTGGDDLPIEKGESTYRYVESLPLDDENSQRISLRKELLEKSPVQEHY
uniref:Transmembrane protein n=1 Tax=Strongyloides papillosus TaxID=174720 RepID=A0A0N5CFY1_STREA